MSAEGVAQHAHVAVIRTRRAAAGLGTRRLLVIGLAILTLASLAYVRQASLVAGAGYDLQELQAIRQRRLATVDQLRLKLAEARGLDRVAHAAEQRGLLAPDQVVYIWLGSGADPVVVDLPRVVSPSPTPEPQPGNNEGNLTAP